MRTLLAAMLVVVTSCGAHAKDAASPSAEPVRNVEPPAKSEDTKLRITGIEPNKGDVEGGTYVRILGNRFLADGARNAKVYFGSRQGTVVRFASDTELIVEAPGGKTGEVVDVLVIFEPGGEMKILQGFSFVERLAPTVGP